MTTTATRLPAIARHWTDLHDAVEVVCGDRALGDPNGTAFDRIIVTAGAWDISTAWWTQLAPGARIVVPLRLHGSGLTRSLAFDHTDDGLMVSTNAVVCGFVPMRGAAEMGERHVRHADDVILKLDADAPPTSPPSPRSSGPASRSVTTNPPPGAAWDCAAKCRGVIPALSARPGSAPCARAALKPATSPFKAP
ncbi:hypothetical protein [Streptomyces sp. NBC_01445]|uniref:hypothetical protein n=1 Tax=Streptomyces sp. NBC_01445 TaxID=2903869 RepID=UPI002DD86F36|nr:hypothetical protein [Streptomyces sp. NBC_01445]WSE11431.1 hypothetical protein OG574_50460 [Streptomyces sp. NBC_01445]